MFVGLTARGPTRSTLSSLATLAASMVLLAAASMLAPPASAAAARLVQTAAPLPPVISFPNGASVAEGGQIAITFDSGGDVTVTTFRYSVSDTHLDSEVPAVGGRATVMVDVGDLSGERPVYAIAVDGDDRRSTLTQQTFTVTVVWNLRGWAIDMVTWLPAEGATVRLEPVGIEVVTGADGSFQFDVDPGLYTVVGTHAGPPVLTGSQQLEIHEYGVTFDLYLFPDSGS